MPCGGTEREGGDTAGFQVQPEPRKALSQNGLSQNGLSQNGYGDAANLGTSRQVQAGRIARGEHRYVHRAKKGGLAIRHHLARSPPERQHASRRQQQPDLQRARRGTWRRRRGGARAAQAGPGGPVRPPEPAGSSARRRAAATSGSASFLHPAARAGIARQHRRGHAHSWQRGRAGGAQGGGQHAARRRWLGGATRTGGPAAGGAPATAAKAVCVLQVAGGVTLLERTAAPRGPPTLQP